jgi:hypothetical protein
MEEHKFPSSQNGISYVAKPDGVYFAEQLVAGQSMAVEVLRLAVREKDLLAIVKPLLPPFKERAEAWARTEAQWDSGPMPARITLTAEFSTEALRALLNKE